MKQDGWKGTDQFGIEASSANMLFYRTHYWQGNNQSQGFGDIANNDVAFKSVEDAERWGQVRNQEKQEKQRRSELDA